VVAGAGYGKQNDDGAELAADGWMAVDSNQK